MVCEQIRLLADAGEMHPVLALLRFTREKDPCEDALALDRVIAGLQRCRRCVQRNGLSKRPQQWLLRADERRYDVHAQYARGLHDLVRQPADHTGHLAAGVNRNDSAAHPDDVGGNVQRRLEPQLLGDRIGSD